MKTKAITQRLLCVMVIATMLLSSLALLVDVPGARAFGGDDANTDGHDVVDLGGAGVFVQAVGANPPTPGGGGGTDGIVLGMGVATPLHPGDMAVPFAVPIRNIWAGGWSNNSINITEVKIPSITYIDGTLADNALDFSSYHGGSPNTTVHKNVANGATEVYNFAFDVDTSLTRYGWYNITIQISYKYSDGTAVGVWPGNFDSEVVFVYIDEGVEIDLGNSDFTVANSGMDDDVTIRLDHNNDDHNTADSVHNSTNDFDFEVIGQASVKISGLPTGTQAVVNTDWTNLTDFWYEGSWREFTLTLNSDTDEGNYDVTITVEYFKYYDDAAFSMAYHPWHYYDQNLNDQKVTEIFTVSLTITQAFPLEVLDLYAVIDGSPEHFLWAGTEDQEFVLQMDYGSGSVDLFDVTFDVRTLGAGDDVFVTDPTQEFVVWDNVENGDMGAGEDDIDDVHFTVDIEDPTALDRAVYTLEIQVTAVDTNMVKHDNCWQGYFDFEVKVEPTVEILDRNEDRLPGWPTWDDIDPVPLYVDDNDIDMMFTLRGDAAALDARLQDNYEQCTVSMEQTPGETFPFVTPVPAAYLEHWDGAAWVASEWVNESTASPGATRVYFNDLAVSPATMALLTDPDSVLIRYVDIHFTGADVSDPDNLSVEKTITLPLAITGSRIQMVNMDPNNGQVDTDYQANPVTYFGNWTPKLPTTWHEDLGIFPGNDSRETFINLSYGQSPIQMNEERGEITLDFTPSTIGVWENLDEEYVPAWAFVDFDYRGDYYGEDGYSQYIGHQLDAATGYRWAAFYVTLPAHTAPGRYEVDGIMTAICNYEDDLYYPTQGDMVGNATNPTPQNGWDHYPTGGYIDPLDDDTNYSFPVTAILRVEPYPALIAEVVEPTVIENETEDVDLQVRFTNVGNVDLLDTRVFLNDATGVELGSANKIEQADGTAFPAPENLLRNIEVGESVIETFPIDILVDCPRDVYDLTFQWTASYRDIFEVNTFGTELDFSQKVNKPVIAQLEVTNRPNVTIEEKDTGAEQQYILYKDHDEGDVEVTLVFTMENKDKWAQDNFEDMTAVLDGDMFAAPVYGVFEDGKEGENDVNYGNTVDITFLATFLKATPGGEYNATVTITALTPSGIEEGVTSVEQRVYTVKIIVKKLKVVDPAEFIVYTTGVDLECALAHFLDNDAEFDITDLNATLDYVAQDGTQLFENRNNSGYSAWATFSAPTIEMDGGADNVTVTFDPVLLVDAPAGTYYVMMTFTGMIGTPTGMAQPITMTYLWEITVNNTRVRVNGGKAVGTDKFPSNAVFYAGEEFEELVVPIENMLAQNQVTDIIHDVEVELFLGESQNQDDLNDYVTWANGINTCLIDQIASGLDGIVRPGFRISIPKDTPPGTYACYMNIVYYDKDGNMYTEDYIPFDIIIEYTPFIEVTAVDPGVIEQDELDSYYEEFEVTFLNSGNVDLYNVTLWTMLGCDFDGSGFWLLECAQNTDNHTHDDETSTEFIYETDWAIGQERTYTYRLFINENLHYGNWRIGIGQTGWYYDGGITGSTITEFVKDFNWNYRTGFDLEYPAHGTYIPLYVNLLPDFSVTMPTVYIPTNDIAVTLDGFVVSLRNADPDVNLGFGDVEIEMLANPMFVDTAPVMGTPMDYYVPGETVQLIGTQEGAMFYFPASLRTGLVPRDYRIPFRVTVFNRENVQDPANSDQDYRTSGVIYVDCSAMEPAMMCECNSCSTPLEQGGRLINLGLQIDSESTQPSTLYDAELNVFLGNTPYIYPIRTADVHGNPIASDVLVDEWQTLSSSSMAGVSIFDIDLDVQRDSGIYVIPTQLTGYLYSFQSDMVDQMFTYQGDYEVRLFPSPPILHIVDMYTDEIQQGKEFNLTFVLRNSGGDDARNVYVNLWSFWWEDLERSNTQYLFLDEFVNSISGKYKEENHTGDWDYFEVSSETDIFTQGDKVIRWRNMTMDELGVDGMSDIYNVSLDRERMLTSPRPAWDSLYFTEIESGEEIEVTYRMAADCHFLTCKPYQVEAYVSYEDSLEKSYSDSYNLTIFDETSVQDTSKKTLEEVTGYAMLAVVLLVIVIILLCFALYMLSSGGKTKKPASEMEEEEFPEEEEFEDEFEEEEFEDEMEEEPAFEEEPEMPEPEPEPMPEPEPEPSVEEELGSIEDEIKDIE